MTIGIRIVGNDNVLNKPNIGHVYTLIFIKGNHLAELLGNESTSEFHIYENGELFGNLKAEPFLSEETKLKNQIEQLELSALVKVGLFKVTKIVLWGKNKCAFSLHGEAKLFDEILYDDETNIWKCNLDSKIKKYGWANYINEEKKYIEEKKRIKRLGWDDTKPLNKNNHPPDMNYPPDIFNNINLHISKNNKTGYKNIVCFNNQYYFKKDIYETSEMYDSPVVAAYNYALWKTK